ncbi:MAG: hypothetical protein Q9160_004554 [Pyrenula sp. 1 TL-2023]
MSPSRIAPPTSSDPSPIGLTKSQLAQFNEDGFLLIPDYLSKSTCTSLLETTHTMLRDFSLTDHPLTKFTTGSSSSNSSDDSSSDSHVSDNYFMTSHDKIRFFFEPTAFSTPTPSSPTSTLLKPKEHAINKIGHYLHGLSPPFSHISQSGPTGARNAAIARSLGFHDPRILQSMVICKQPEIGAEVPPHQDSTFLYTRPPSAVGWWIALEDATRGNGCLGFLRGSHRREPVRKRFVRKRGERETGTEFMDVDIGNTEEAWPRGLEALVNNDGKGGAVDGDGDEEEYTLGEVKAGTLVLIHGNLLHKSEQNLSGKSRFIYTFHVIEGSEARDENGQRWQYDERNWLQPPEGGEFTRLKGSS